MNNEEEMHRISDIIRSLPSNYSIQDSYDAAKRIMQKHPHPQSVGEVERVAAAFIAELKLEYYGPGKWDNELWDNELADVGTWAELREKFIKFATPAKATLATQQPASKGISEVFDRAIDPVGEHGNKATIPCAAGVASSTSDPQQPQAPASDELVKALTPSAETKAAYMSAFKFNLELHAHEGDEGLETYIREVVVPWTTIKEIMTAIRKRATLTEQQPQSGDVVGHPRDCTWHQGIPLHCSCGLWKYPTLTEGKPSLDDWKPRGKNRRRIVLPDIFVVRFGDKGHPLPDRRSGNDRRTYGKGCDNCGYTPPETQGEK